MGSRCVYKMVEYPNRSQKSFAKLDGPESTCNADL
jgi:hypothetical protein